MSETSDLESRLKTQEADYLKRLEDTGKLPTVITDAWNQADNGETAKLRGEEANLLTNYVSAGAKAREKYQDIWDPFKRDSLAAQQVSQEYQPIADVRKELAMRADALSAATGAAVTTYNADTAKMESSLGFTKDAYSRALDREREATRQAERLQEHQWTVDENAKSRAASAAKAAKKDPGYKFDVVNKEDTNGNFQGLSITDKTGKPITLKSYISGYAEDEFSPADFVPYLQRSQDPGDQKIISDIQSGMTTAELIKKYPWVFGD